MTAFVKKALIGQREGNMDHNCFPLCPETILVTPQLIKYLGGIYYVLLLYAIVTGEANFVMD